MVVGLLPFSRKYIRGGGGGGGAKLGSHKAGANFLQIKLTGINLVLNISAPYGLFRYEINDRPRTARTNLSTL